jgi:ATP-dependent Clp protease adaptor protein ClpS
MVEETKGNTAVIEDTNSTTLLGKPYNVVLFNDNSHDMLEVTMQIIKAIHCNASRAAAIMQEAHTTGRAIVFTGSLERAEHVEAVLAEIRLGTKIEPA